MAPAQSGLCRATRVNGQLPTLLGNPGVKFPGLASSNFPEKVSATKGPLRASERKYLEVRVDKANEILGMDNFRLHPFCVSAYYPGEAQEVIEARKTSFVPGKKSAPGSRREDCFFFETIRIPFNPRQQLLHVDIFEVQVPLQMEFEDEWVGRATLQLADPRVEEPAEYELTRGPFEYGGTVTVSVKFPDPEVEAHPLPDVRDFPKPVSPREYANSKTMGTDAGGIDMSPFDIPRKGSGSSSNSTGQGKSPPQPVWVPEIKGPGGSGFGLDPKIDNIWKFNTGRPDWSERTCIAIGKLFALALRNIPDPPPLGALPKPTFGQVSPTMPPTYTMMPTIPDPPKWGEPSVSGPAPVKMSQEQMKRMLDPVLRFLMRPDQVCQQLFVAIGATTRVEGLLRNSFKTSFRIPSPGMKLPGKEDAMLQAMQEAANFRKAATKAHAGDT